ncbi:MAG: hypothetical protein R2705_16025 [Ilumatobacteraceae bacterium]
MLSQRYDLNADPFDVYRVGPAAGGQLWLAYMYFLRHPRRSRSSKIVARPILVQLLRARGREPADRRDQEAGS